jgi:hypothetical protein
MVGVATVGAVYVIGARASAVLERTVSTPDTVDVFLAWIRTVVVPTGSVAVPVHEVLAAEAARDK